MAKFSRVTMLDVAQNAGVSRSAVWAAFDTKNGTNIGISDEKRKLILKIAKELNYVPDIRARSLRTNKSYMIGLLGRKSFQHYMMDILSGVQDACFQEDYSVVTYFHGDTIEDETRHISLSLKRQLDALILMPPFFANGKSNLKKLLKLHTTGTPIVQLFATSLRGIPAILVNNFEVGYQATKLLLEKGHRKIVHATYSGYLEKGTDGAEQHPRLRYDGYCKAMLEAGLEPKVVVSKHPEFGQREFIDLAYNEIVPQILDMKSSMPTAIFAYTDYISLGLIKGFYEKGIIVPDDISIISFDGLDLETLNYPVLTSLTHPLEEMGKLAFRSCFEKIGSDLSDKKEPQALLLQPEIKQGQTVIDIA